MLNRLRSLDAIDAPFALGERILPPAPAAALAPKAVADWTRATMADLPADILTDAERGALAEAFPVPKCIAKPAVDMHDSAPVENRQRCRIPAAECLVPVDLSSANDPELRAVAERMAALVRKTYGGGIGLASSEAPAKDDGWRLHVPGEPCPVSSRAMGVIRLRNGETLGSESAPTRLRDREWSELPGFRAREITSYRVVPQ